jgi:hypothetical protein
MIVKGRRAISKPFCVVPYTQMHAGTTAEKVWQEFFCRTTRSEESDKKTPPHRREQVGCGGYFVVGLMCKFTGKVNMKCPKCGHVHTRFVQNGYIQEKGRGEKGESIDLTIMLSAWSQEPRTTIMHRKVKEHIEYPNTWDAVVIKSVKDLIPEARDNENEIGRLLLRESWMNKVHEGERQ